MSRPNLLCVVYYFRFARCSKQFSQSPVIERTALITQSHATKLHRQVPHPSIVAKWRRLELPLWQAPSDAASTHAIEELSAKSGGIGGVT
jgi:hypothetical protein